jgi:predicted metalloprotease
VVVVAMLLLGVSPSRIADILGGGQTEVQQPAPGADDPIQARQKDFVSAVLADTEDTWQALFARAGSQYVPPKLVLFTGADETGCGGATSAVGPFYCPRDRRVYLDLEFFDQLRRRFGAPGEFAEAYVVAHEVGHHVQNLLGTSVRVRPGETGAMSGSVRLELQADCYAGVWANHADRARHILEKGDVESGLRAANAIGDDTLQTRARGRVMPDAFTHGTSAQRVHWFKVGLEAGDVDACDTFRARSL